MQTIDADLGDVGALPTGESASLIRVTRSGEVAIRSLDGDHPYDALIGFVAPDDWEVFGVIAPGWGTYYAGPKQGERRRVRAIHVASRMGEEAALLRFAGAESELVPCEAGPAPGRVADCIRRSLGLPTTAEPERSLVAWWGDSVMRRVAARAHPSYGGKLVDLEEVERLIGDEPATWDDERWAVVEAGGSPLMDATVAAWMDAGMFARTVLADMVEPGIAMDAAKRACTPEAWRHLLDRFVEFAMRFSEVDDFDDFDAEEPF